MKSDVRFYDREDIKAIAQVVKERARLCDPVRLAHDLKAIARIRRKMQLARANKAVALERARKEAAA